LALILNIETATVLGSVTVSENGIALATVRSKDAQTHAAHLTTFITDALRQAGKQLTEIDAVAISEGPGSYTGLRIGLSTAKGICYTLGKPLIAVGSLHALAAATRQQVGSDADAVFCPMIDARRMEVYTAIYDADLQPLREVQPLIVGDETFWSEWLEAGKKVIFSGDGAEKCRAVITHENAVFVPQLNCSSGMVAIAEAKFEAKAWEDVAYFAPFYLKSPNITKPKAKL
jgi:tRNA threonylcarbamoyladenosine biosynthesis protein TsaB